jgi:hypothetical protein
MTEKQLVDAFIEVRWPLDQHHRRTQAQDRVPHKAGTSRAVMTDGEEHQSSILRASK